MITKQEIFNKVWNHFVVNKGEPSVDTKHQHCRYRKSGKADDPCRCAAGLFIPDAQYTPEMDKVGQGVFELTRNGLRGEHGAGFKETAAMFYGEENFFVVMQAAHDKAVRHDTDFHCGIATRLRSAAAECGLEVPA